MSLKRTREALERLQRKCMADAEVTELVAEAIQEVQAIEKAAAGVTAWHADGIAPGQTLETEKAAFRAGMTTLRSIAEESK